MSELSERASSILRAVVTEFIETGEPVASRALAQKYQLSLSSASIRNVLGELEEAGYLYQPHTSAGRLPTEQAFRVFVDALMSVQPLSGHEEAQIQALDRLVPGETLLRESGRVLSTLTGTAAVIVAPRTDRRRLRQLHFIITSTPKRSLLAVLLFADGTVESRFVDEEAGLNEPQLERVHNMLEEVVQGKTLEQVRDLFAQRLRQDLAQFDQLMRRAYELGFLATERSPQNSPLVMIEGQNLLLEQPDFEDVEQLRKLMRALDERERIVMLLDRTIWGRTAQVLVGHETGNLANGALSLVIAPFAEAGRTLGTIGVLGPTRMNYPKMVALVSAMAGAVTAAHDRASSGPDSQHPHRTSRSG